LRSPLLTKWQITTDHSSRSWRGIFQSLTDYCGRSSAKESGNWEIGEYSDDKPFPSALFLGYGSGKPLHVVAACDETRPMAFVITAYEPSAKIFDADNRTKRK
jgi:hypothetical protein